MNVVYIAEWRKTHPTKRAEPTHPFLLWWKLWAFMVWGKWV